MNRVEKSRIKKEFVKKFVYPVIISLTIVIMLVLIVDYRINSSMGEREVRIVQFINNDFEKVGFKIFNQNAITINLIYIKRDIRSASLSIQNFSNKIRCSVEKSVIEVFNTENIQVFSDKIINEVKLLKDDNKFLSIILNIKNYFTLNNDQNKTDNFRILILLY